MVASVPDACSLLSVSSRLWTMNIALLMIRDNKRNTTMFSHRTLFLWVKQTCSSFSAGVSCSASELTLVTQRTRTNYLYSKCSSEFWDTPWKGIKFAFLGYLTHKWPSRWRPTYGTRDNERRSPQVPPTKGQEVGKGKELVARSPFHSLCHGHWKQCQEKEMGQRPV